MPADWRIGAGLLIVLALFNGVPAYAQPERHWSDAAWTPIIEHRGMSISYIFYSEADNTNNGVVIRLINENEHAVRYRFDVVFRTWEGEEHVERVEGTLRPHQMKTGDNDGLFWIPFVDGRTIGEVGLRDYHVAPIRGEVE